MPGRTRVCCAGSSMSRSTCLAWAERSQRASRTAPAPPMPSARSAWRRISSARAGTASSRRHRPSAGVTSRAAAGTRR
eukprot:1701228-Prymnesium_polylepis.2